VSAAHANRSQQQRASTLFRKTLALDLALAQKFLSKRFHAQLENNYKESAVVHMVCDSVERRWFDVFVSQSA
jgi:hypothetical protein